MKDLFLKFYHDSHKECRMSVINLLESNSKVSYLDCGCDEGSFTKQVADKIGTKKVYGIEIGKEAAAQARKKGITIKSNDLNKKFPFSDSCLDVVTANQVIEHLYDTDNFIKEIKRVLKPGGYAIISTNNLASWHNIIALLLGYQPFPNDVSSHNPSLGKLIKLFEEEAGSFAHLRIFTYASLKQFMEYHEFIIEDIVGIGYYPLPSFIANILARLDKRHAAYLTLKVRKIR